MFEKFEAFMNKYFVPLAHKVDNQRHLSAIKTAMVAMTPFTILGSFFSILPALPNMIGDTNVVGKWIVDNSELLNLPVTLSIGMLSLYVVMCISYQLGKYYKLYIPGCVTLSTFAFMFISVDFTDGSLVITNFGTKGLFCAILVGLIAVELYRICKEHNITIRMPDNVPDFVSKSFELIPITVIVAGTFILVRILSLQFFGTLPPQILTKFMSPLVGSMDNIWAVMFVGFLMGFVFFFGIHPSILTPVTKPIMTLFVAENIQALAAGEPLKHFYTAGTSSACMGFTGTGITIGLVIACMMSKNERYKKIGKISIFPSLFGINEPILFGAPIILNPIMFIPFIISATFISTIPLMLMNIGWITKPFFDPPYVGIFLEGFLTNLDYRIIVAHIIQLVLSILIYRPFFKIMEKQEKQKEIENQKNKSSVFSDDELKILDDMGLDF